MKKLLLFLSAAVYATSFVFAQDLIDPDDRRGRIATFENEELVWDAFDCDNEASFEIIANPTGWGTVGEFTTTACTWEGVALMDQFEYFDFSVRNLFMVDVYAPEAGRTVMFKVEDYTNSAINVEVQATTTVANEWETLEFDFSGAEAGKYDKIAIFPDFNGENAGETWYIDNVKKYRAPLTYENGVLVNFEDKLPYFFNWSCATEPAITEVIDNPVKSDINPSDRVLLYVTSDCTYDGFATDEVFELFDFSERWVFKVKVYAPAEGLKVRFKLEDFKNNNNNPISLDQFTTKAGEWEEISWDFSTFDPFPESDFYGKIAIFPDMSSDTYGDEWLIDDIMFVNPETGVEKKPTLNGFKLTAANYPNPFNPMTTISYQLPFASDVKLDVYDVSGRLVQSLVDEHKAAGEYCAQFNAADLASGVYIYRLTTADLAVSGKMLLVK